MTIYEKLTELKEINSKTIVKIETENEAYDRHVKTAKTAAAWLSGEYAWWNGAKEIYENLMKETFEFEAPGLNLTYRDGIEYISIFVED